MKRDFYDLIYSLKDTINGYDWFVDFDSAINNLKKIESELTSLNALIGTNNFASDFEQIFKLNPNISTVLPILIAIRSKQIKVLDGSIKTYSFDCNKNSVSDYITLLEKTGFKRILENKLISNLYDYVLGIEAGINTNARKNRSGKEMEKLVKSFLMKDLNCRILSQVDGKQIAEKLKNKSLINAGLVTKKNKDKRFDFAFELNDKLYVVECNFYSSQGSKLASTVGQYIELNEKIKKLSNVVFIWVTDGKGWLKTKKDFEDGFNSVEHLYNIEDLEQGILKRLL
jgi:type II restriction enzyme